MPSRIEPRIPSYRLHKPTGRAVVRLNGRDVYLGKHGTSESQIAYKRVISEWLANCCQLPPKDMNPRISDLTINEIGLPYWKFAQQYYRKRGRPTSEVSSIKRALRPLMDLYGTSPVSEFGPLALKAYRDRLIASDLSRGVVNNHVGRVKRMFRWATENELVPPHVYQALQAVTGLRQGRSAARVTQPITGNSLALTSVWSDSTGRWLRPNGGLSGSLWRPTKSSRGTNSRRLTTCSKPPSSCKLIMSSCAG